MTGDALIAKDPAQIGSTLSEAPKSANAFKSANDLKSDDVLKAADVSKSANVVALPLNDKGTSGTAPEGLTTAHPKPAKRLNARERQMAKKSGGLNDKDISATTADGTTPMTATAKSKVEDKVKDKAGDRAAKARVKAAQKAQKADTKARKISAAKAAKAARG